MTRPIPAGQPRKRPAQSCVPCRTSKVKCVGVEISAGQGKADVPCTRCARQGLSCEFAGLKRFGRPRRKVKDPKGEHELNERNAEEHYPDLGDFELSAQVFEQGATIVEEGWFQDTVRHSDGNFGDAVSSPGSSLIRSPSPVHSISSTHSSPILSYLSFDSAATGLYQRPLDFDHFTSLAQEYLTEVHPFVSILPDDRDVLAAYLQLSSPTLLMAVYSILGPPHVELIPLASYGSTLSDLQAACISVHAAYSRGKVEVAREKLQWLCNQIIEKRYHQIDSPSHQQTYEFGVKDSIRLLWWETWSVDRLLSIVTGSRTLFLGAVSFSVRPAGDTIDSPSNLRVRALSLLVSCAEPPAPDADVNSRLDALNSMAATLAVLAHHAYLDLCNQLLNAPLKHRPRLAADREAAFMASLISTASTIFLLSSSSVFSKLTASAFPCGLDTTTSPPISAHLLIRQASSHILSLIRTSYSPGVARSVHSPFFGCSLLVASQGTLLTLHDGPGTYWRGEGALSDLEFAEFVLEKQMLVHPVAEGVLKEVRMLRVAVLGADDRGAQLLVASS